MIKRISHLKIKKKHVLFCLILLCSLIIFSVYLLITKYKTPADYPSRSWSEIKDKGNLRVGILYNYTDYYVSHGAIYGFHYEMVKKMAKHLNIHITYIVYNSYKEYYKALLTNKVDLLAMDIIPSMETKLLFNYSLPHSYSAVALIQNKKKSFFDRNDSSLSADKTDYQLMIPLTTHHKEASFFINTYGANIHLVSTSLFSDDIIHEINNGDCDFTLAYYKNIHANSIFYKNIDYSFLLTEPLALHWIVRKRTDSLLFYIDQWMESFTQSRSYTFLLEKYYNPNSVTRTLLKYKSQYTPFGHISPYDEIIEKHAVQTNLDWLLVSALIYQESKFHVHSSGYGGAYGLMQFMPIVASYWGINIGDSPEKQIKAGCNYLKFLKKKYYESGVKDTNQLMKFMLAAYNAGTCHIDDARILAKKYNLNVNKWDDNVERALIMLSDKKITKKAKLNCDRYSQGNHTIKYINEIINRYHHYKNLSNQKEKKI